MKKLFTVVALCSILGLAGCAINEEPDDFLPLTEETSFLKSAIRKVKEEKNWESVTFKSISGNEDLTVTRNLDAGNPFAITTSAYNGNFLAVAIYEKDCEICKIQAPWFDMLAEEFAEFHMDFIIIFSDIFADSDLEEVAWVNDLSHVDAYTNVATACTSDACREVFAPMLVSPAPGTIYFVDKNNITQTSKGPMWPETIDPQELYQATNYKIAKFLGLHPISFGASVADSSEQDITETNL